MHMKGVFACTPHYLHSHFKDEKYLMDIHHQDSDMQDRPFRNGAGKYHKLSHLIRPNAKWPLLSN
jgi:hypothetical protein